MPAEHSRAYVDRAVGDVAAAQRLAERAAGEWALPAPALLRRGMNAIFGAGDAVLRVGRPNAPASVAIELADRLDARGVRVARPVHHDVLTAGELAVTCWERLEPTGGAIDWTAVGRIVALVHSLDVSIVPDDHPLPSPTRFPWWDFDAMLAETADAIDAGALAGLRAGIARWPRWSEMADAVVCHGDVHPGNVVMTAGGPVLIDWDLVCRAPRGWDHAPMMTWATRWGGAVGEYEQFARGYGTSMRGDPSAEAFAELRLVAATLMRVRAGRVDPAARPEAERRLAYWRGESDASVWRAQ